MPALPYPVYGISNLYLFPVYQTREAYQQATGQEAPAYDPNQPVKSWFDPHAMESAKRKIIYDNVLALGDTGLPYAGPDGKPALEPLMLEKEVAARVNIPPKAVGKPDLPEKGFEIQVPLRPLEKNEEMFFQFGNIVAIKNTDLFPSLEVGFTAQDRALLKTIAQKLGL
jgi:hypothetical protein